MNCMLYAYTAYVLHLIYLFHSEALKFRAPPSTRVFFQPTYLVSMISM